MAGARRMDEGELGRCAGVYINSKVLGHCNDKLLNFVWTAYLLFS